MVDAGQFVSKKSNRQPRISQWKSFFFACLKNTMLVLPTGKGKTFIAEMLIKAYHDLNPGQIIVFVVPTIVLVDQQATNIEKNTGLKVQRRSGEHDGTTQWSSDFVCVCTPAMIVQAIEFGEVLVSQTCLMLFDEVIFSKKNTKNKIISYNLISIRCMRPTIQTLTMANLSQS